MSMDVFISAGYPVRNLKTGEVRTLEESFDTWQTRTEDAYRIMRSDDPIQAYCDWVLSISKEEKRPRYSEYDAFEEGPVVGYDTYHPGKEHVAELLEWVKRMKSLGGTVKVEVA